MENCYTAIQPSATSFEGISLVDSPLVLSGQNRSCPLNHSSNLQSTCSAVPSTSSTSAYHNSANYDGYLTVIGALSDVSSEDEEMHQAILASLQSERLVVNCLFILLHILALSSSILIQMYLFLFISEGPQDVLCQ